MESPSVRLLENRMNISSDGISPVTDLAKNLSTLSTEITPCRRISWNNPFPSEKKAKSAFTPDSPYEINSPSIDEGILRDKENMQRSGLSKRKSIQPLRKFLFSGIQDKENVDDAYFASPFKSNPSPIKPLAANNRQDSQSDFSGASQESGYGSTSEKYSEVSFKSSIPSVRSSVFTDDETEDDEAFFSVDKYVEADDLMEHSLSSVTQLLTKPLSSSKNSNEDRPESDPSEPQTSICSNRQLLHWKQKSLVCITEASSSSEDLDQFTANSQKPAFKRPEPIDDLTPLQAKRRRSSPSIMSSVQEPANYARLHRCYSETAATIMRAVQKSDQEPNLIGDFSRPFFLPLIPGRHQDLKTISCETLARLLRGDYNQTVKHFSIIDCRYPYEYEGGHIIGAKNVYTKETLYSDFLSSAQLPENELDQQNLAVFHCEFSSERAPKLLRYLRSKDREINEDVYPRLHHPEIYLLEGGYRAFFENFKELCVPQTYKPMLHKDHSSELRVFRSKSKSFSQDFPKGRPKLRSNLKF